MHRRSFLAAAVGTTAALGGCAGFDPVRTRDSTTTTAPARGTTDRPPADRALVVESTLPVEGANVNLGVQGTARNAASSPLAECLVAVTGDVGTRTFDAFALRDHLAPDEAWEWEVAFGREADASNDDGVENVVVVTRAEYAD